MHVKLVGKKFGEIIGVFYTITTIDKILVKYQKRCTALCTCHADAKEVIHTFALHILHIKLVGKKIVKIVGLFYAITTFDKILVEY